MSQTRVGGIFVRTDDPRYLEEVHEPHATDQVFDVANVNVVQLRDSYLAKQSNYSTAPFDPLGSRVRFFPSGFTIWSGYPGAGKTTLLRQLACHLMQREQHVFVASLEETPEDVFMRHACVALGAHEPATDGLQWCADMWADRLKLWNYRPGRSDAKHQKLFAAIRVLSRDYGVRHAIIDSLMCLDVSAKDIEDQRLFTHALAMTTELAGCHVHLVAHPRKPNQANQDIDINDVAGSADLGRKADNVMFIKRAVNEQLLMTEEVTPMTISVKKQRFGTGWIGDITGHFNRRLKQFTVEQFQTLPTRYLPDSAYRPANVDQWGEIVQ